VFPSGTVTENVGNKHTSMVIFQWVFCYKRLSYGKMVIKRAMDGSQKERKRKWGNGLAKSI
jgi:hypothetical protein